MNARLKSGQLCICGSKLGHFFDLNRFGHYTFCYKKRHEEFVDKPHPATLFDFFCECGGLYIPTMLSIKDKDGRESLIEYGCPTCMTMWRIFAPLVQENKNCTVNPFLLLAQAHSIEIGYELRKDIEVLKCVELLRDQYGMQVENTLLDKFVRKVSGTFPEPTIPPQDMQEVVRFKDWAGRLKLKFKDNLQAEEEAGLYIWVK